MPAVLIIEDDNDTRAILSIILSHHGFQVLEARTGAEGLQAARAERPAAIILDVGLPDIDGRQIAAALAADQATSGIPIIVASVLDPAEYPNGPNIMGRLVKPFEPSAIVREVSRILSASAQ